MSDRFDLEQQILDCWKVTSDTKILYDRLEFMSRDEQMNYLLGLNALYEQKFEILWSTFEQLTHDKKIT
jgi:hypothetical protein